MFRRLLSAPILLAASLALGNPVVKPELSCDPLCGGRAGCGSDRFSAIEHSAGKIQVTIEFDRTEPWQLAFKLKEPFRTMQYEVPTSECRQGQGTDISSLVASCSSVSKTPPSVKFIDYEGKTIGERPLWMKLETKFVTSVGITKSGPRPELEVIASVTATDANSSVKVAASFVPEHCAAKSVFGAR